MRKVAFYTLGCKVNQYETEAMRELFEKNGDQIVNSEDTADVYVINTCTVTSMSDKKSRQFVRKCKRMNPEAIIVVAGCYSQIAPKDVIGIEGVNLVIGTDDRNNIVNLIKNVTHEDKIEYVSDIMKIREFEEMKVDQIKGKTRAFIKIQEGCNQFCTYCIIPYARGPIRSRKPQNVLDEVKRLVKNGFEEIVLTGIHVASYGKDLDVTLLELIKDIHEIEGLKRIRTSSVEPNLLTEDFVSTIAGLEKVCDHYHMSLQSGTDETLKRMNRKYTTAEYQLIVDRLRRYIPGVSLTTDVIVGFPGETDEDFEATYEFVKSIGFSQMHVFKFSPREGTPAAKMTDQISPDVKNKRSERLIALGKSLEAQYAKTFVGESKEVIVERIDSKTGAAEGLTTNYLRVYLPNEGYEEGQSLIVKITGYEEGQLMGNNYRLPTVL